MSRRRKGFTLIELLVVIAIIAIITAILVPVFFNAKESGRQGTVMSNFRQISTGLERYHLEFHQYPQVLFGYAVSGKADEHSCPCCYRWGLIHRGFIPSYVKTADVFQDPNNTADPADPAATVTGGGPTAYYTADAFDVNPDGDGFQYSGNSTVTASSPMRYNRTWTTTTTDPDYARQLQQSQSAFRYLCHLHDLPCSRTAIR